MADLEIASTETKYLATLIRGEHYGLRNFAWDLGRTLVVGESHMLHLQMHAVDDISTSDGEGMTRDKFEFEPYTGPHPIGFKFPTEGEVDAKERKLAQRERSRRIALAKAEPIVAQARTRVRQKVA